MLDPARPPFVTVLTLVRDAVSRLQHGEGSRSEIMSLLMDSKYLIKVEVNILAIKGHNGRGGGGINDFFLNGGRKFGKIRGKKGRKNGEIRSASKLEDGGKF